MSEESQIKNLPGIDEGQASDESIVKTHARIRREPTNASPVLFFTSMALIAVLVFGWFYLRRYMGGENNEQIYLHERSEIALYKSWLDRPRGPIVYDYYAIGQDLYTKMACVGCHMPDGQGKPGEFPPLVDSEYVILDDPALPTKILLSGLIGPITVKGDEYNGNMPAYGAGLKDHEIAGLVTYIRNTWGNEASEVTADEVAVVRAEIGERPQWTAEELASYLD